MNKYLYIYLYIYIYILLVSYQSPPPKEKLCDWYHGTLDRGEAIRLLHENGDIDGSFLVRLSYRHGGMYVLSVMYHKQTYHFQIHKKVNIKVTVYTV